LKSFTLEYRKQTQWQNHPRPRSLTATYHWFDTKFWSIHARTGVSRDVKVTVSRTKILSKGPNGRNLRYESSGLRCFTRIGQD